MIQNYPKYYSFDFLFESGESAFPGSFIQRHSVEGARLLSWTILPLLLLGLLSFVALKRGDHDRAYAPFVVLAFLVPLPDLVTTLSSRPPYTYAMFTGVLLIPFIVDHGLTTLETYRSSANRGRTSSDRQPSPSDSEQSTPFWSIWMLVTSVRFITLMIAISAFFFVFATYARYPLVSSDYWGWQAGPREMIGYYIDHLEEYDAFYMEGKFNQPEIFLDFYIDDLAARDRASIGNTDEMDLTQRQLFGLSAETFKENNLNVEDWSILETVYYPNDEIAFYLIARKAT